MAIIIHLLEQIKSDEIVLPAIQRDFVWSEEKIEKLLDSIMRGYPIGIILLWETFNDIQYRNFVKDYRSDMPHTFYDNDKQNKLKLILDGQQRLQSLYIALYGTYVGKQLYFDILSGCETEDFKENKFIFDFLSPKEANELNENYISVSQKIGGKNGEENEVSYYCRVNDLISFGAKEKQRFQQEISKKLNLSDKDALRVDLNLSLLFNVLMKEDNILKTIVLDENLPRDNKDRKSESDILEAFVRINREGTPLSRSDLIFSMLKLNWKESAETLPEFVNNINKGNSFELDSDFVIRCLFAVSDLGTRFDINLLRKKSNVKTIQTHFEKCCKAISSVVDFVQSKCWIASSKLLGGYYNLVPFVYYLFHTKDHQIPNKEIDRIRKAVYLFGFTSPFSRYADSRLGKFIREALKPLAENHDEKFPLEESLKWSYYWEKFRKYGSQLIQGNPSLALHLIQRRSGAKVHYEKNSPQIDHIFPRSVLRQMKYDEAEINHFANFWILAKHKNQNKSNKHPKEYFEDVTDSELQEAYIDRNLLDYPQYKNFLKKREAEILKRVKNELNLSDSDYDVSAYLEID
nr:DUF262 domain-containing protein [Candidatus Freyarchaeota archaeon]